jgi:hypothetical protein
VIAPSKTSHSAGGYPLYPPTGRGRASLPTCPSVFESAEAAREWASECWPHISFYFAGLDPAALTPFLQELHRLSASFPEVMHRLKEVRQEKDYTSDLWPTDGGRTLILERLAFENAELFLRSLAKQELRKNIPKGCASIEAATAMAYGRMYDNWLSGTHSEDPEITVPTDVAFCTYASLWQEFGLVCYTFSRFKRTVRQRGLGRDLDRYKAEHLMRMRFAYGFSSSIHTPASERVPYVNRLSALLEALDRSNWVVRENYRFLHEAGEDMEEGYILLDQYAKSFGMDVELVKPVDY